MTSMKTSQTPGAPSDGGNPRFVRPATGGGEPLTVVLVVDSAGNEGNGTSNSALQFARELRALGHVARIVGVGGEWPARAASIPIVTPIAARQQMSFGVPDDALFASAFRGADIVHLYLPFPFERAALRVARRMRIPVSCAFHLQPENVLYSAGPLRYVPGADALLYRLFRRWMYRDVRHVHVPTRMTADLLRAHGYRNDLHVISNGYDPAFAPRPGEASARPWQPGEGRPFRVLASGRLASEKDHATLIRALGLCRHRADVELVIAGTGPLDRSLRREAARCLARPADIGFHRHEDMPGLLRSADLLVHPSIADLEGVSVLEALACGLVPVIADSPLSAAKDFALDGRSLFPVGDERALADRIDWWIDHPQERSRMGGEYARYVARTHSLRSSVAAFVDMEREAIADDRAWYAGHPRPAHLEIAGPGTGKPAVPGISR
ncbi:glycosyltransferase [Pseudoscardovia radai]|uniref:glycosyltransferase n=1 Tax=Pseudoscardovia radai TaxID=987066 RepID=UPI003994011C